MPRILTYIVKLLRVSTWWNHIVPPIFFSVYAMLWMNPSDVIAAVKTLGWFALSVIGTASFGYFSNDAADVIDDRLSGKQNVIGKLSLKLKIGLCFLLLCLSLLPWLKLPFHWYTFGLMTLLLLLFISYSFPPIRLKSRGLIGNFADTAYGHVLPIVITIATFFSIQPIEIQNGGILMVVLAVILFIKGWRNIILHQIEDRKSDSLAGVSTFVLRFGPLRSTYLVNRILLPLEIALLGGFLVVLCNGVRYIAGVYLLFLIVAFFRFNVWRIPMWPKHQRTRHLWYFLNSAYEGWLPTGTLVLLLWEHPSLWPLLFIHLVVFYVPSLNIIEDIRVALKQAPLLPIYIWRRLTGRTG